MGRLIDADALIKKAYDEAKGMAEPYDDFGVLVEWLVNKSPTIEPERKKGKWIEEPNCYYRCSRCSSHYPSILGYMDYKYCPNCGADMKGEKQ